MPALLIPQPHRLSILERLARDGDPYAMYALSDALPRGSDGERTEAAERWLTRAAAHVVKAQLHPFRYGLGLEPRPMPRAAAAWARRAARTRHPVGLRAAAWIRGDRTRMRAPLVRAVRAGSAAAAFDLATIVESFRGNLRYVRRWLRIACTLGMHEDRAEFALALVTRAAPFLRRYRARPSAWRRLADAGDPEALLHVGYARRFGRQGAYDPAGAQATLEAAASRGSSEAALALALMVYDVEVDVGCDEAAAWAARAAASDDPVALWIAGELNSTQTPTLKRRAVSWLRRAAGAGEVHAAYRLACAYRYGGFVRKDARAAERWGRVAASLGHDGAMALLASLYTQRKRATRTDRSAAAAMRRRAALCGNFDDWTNWGVLLHEGRGVRRDDREAVRWYRRAAAKGCPAATTNLGRCYRRGHGVRKSPRAAVRWFRRAVDVFDNPEGASILADMYRSGELGKPDPRRAVVWLRRAAAMGDAMALRDLGIAYHEGDGVPKDYAFAAQLYRAGAEGGNGWSAYCLAQCYRDGEGVGRDRRAGVRWFRRAIARGVSEARKDLRRWSATRK